MPARVLMQDFTGVPAVVDLAAMRDAMADIGGDPAAHRARWFRRTWSSTTPCRSIASGPRTRSRSTSSANTSATASATSCCAGRSARSPDCASSRPGRASSIRSTSSTWPRSSAPRDDSAARPIAFPDTLVGTDSHTTMVNGLGVLGYGVGGIEAEAVLLGQPLYQPMPRVVGVRLFGDLPRGSTATDLVLVDHRHAAERTAWWARSSSSPATAWPRWRSPTGPRSRNMSPEYGATAALFPIDDRDAALPASDGSRGRTGRTRRGICQGERLLARAGHGAPTSTRRSSSTSRPSSRPSRDRAGRRTRFACPSSGTTFATRFPADGRPKEPVRPVRRDRDRGPRLRGHRRDHLVHQHQQPVRHGRRRRCSRAMRSPVDSRSSRRSRRAWRPGRGQSPSTCDARTCSSRSRTLALASWATAARRASATRVRSTRPSPRRSKATSLVVAAVLSGNRNFEGRIHPLARASYLASPPLVVAFALAGTVEIDLLSEPLGTGSDGKPVYMAEIWPSPKRSATRSPSAVSPDIFKTHLRVGVRRGRALARAAGSVGSSRYDWDEKSTYVARPPFLDGITREPAPVERHRGRPRPGGAGRLGHDRPHLPGRIDPGVEPGRPVAAGARRRAAGVQQLRRAARPSRRDDARHVRQHPAAQRA